MPDKVVEWMAATAAGGGILAMLVRPLVRISRLETHVNRIEDDVKSLRRHDTVCTKTAKDVAVLMERSDADQSAHERLEATLLKILGRLP